MNKDQVKGRMGQAGGKAKEIAGRIFGNKKLESEGVANQVGGKVQKTYGDAKSAVKNQAKKMK